MLRRVVATLLIIPLLGSQLPALPHSHVGTGMVEPQDHASRPHIHLHVDDGHHHHHGDSHHHHQDSVVDKSSETKADVDEVTVVRSPHDHDHDAVYLPESLTLGMSPKATAAEPSKQLTPLFAFEPRMAESEADFAICSQTRPPPGPFWRCPLYLRTLSMRI